MIPHVDDLAKFIERDFRVSGANTEHGTLRIAGFLDSVAPPEF
jgi:hypothetical protein